MGEAGTVEGDDTASPPKFRADGRLYLILLGLFGIGFSQPFFSLIGANPTFFVAHRSTTTDIVTLVLLIFLGPPTITWLFAFAVGNVAPRLAGLLIPIGLALLTSVAIGGYLWRPFDMQIELALPLVLLLSGITWFLLTRFEEFGTALRSLGMISVAFPILFLFFTPVSGLLGSDGGASSDLAILGGDANDTSVALIVFDEMPLSTMLDTDDQIDRGRLPNFARLADMSTWYRNTTTVSTATSLAVPSISTGSLGDINLAPTADNYPSNLFTELAPTHRVEAWESVTRLCPSDICDFPDLGWSLLLDDSWIVVQNQVLPPGVAKRWVPEINTQWTRFRQPKVTRPRDVKAGEPWEFPWDDLNQDVQGQFRSLTGQIGTFNDPAFYYEHALLPHSPWLFRPDGTPSEGEPIPWLGDNVWPAGPDHERGVIMYGMQLELTDRLLGEFLDSVEASGRFDDMLLIVVSDHGGGLQAGLPARTMTPQTRAELARVPMFVKYPGQNSGSIQDDPREIIDIFPTILEVVGLEGATVEGTTLTQPSPEDRVRTIEADPQEFDDAVGRFQSFVPPGTSAASIFDRLQE